MKSYSNISEYIAAAPAAAQPHLNELYKTIKELMPPEAKDKISYGIPTFWNNRNVVHFGGYEHHVALYPGGIVEQFKDDLKGYKTSKGTVQFPLDKPLPVELITKIVKASLNRS